MGAMRFEKQINYGLKIEVDVRKCDCRREPVHCHIKKGSYRVAQVWLDPVRIEYGSSLDRSEEKLVIEKVREYSYEIREAYENNREYGAEY